MEHGFHNPCTNTQQQTDTVFFVLQNESSKYNERMEER